MGRAEAAGSEVPQFTEASLERVWQLHPAGPEAPGVVYAGTEPAALFRSDDGGESFELVRPLWEHPTRSKWVPGGGGEGLHTILTDPRDARAVTVAVSTAGVFRTKDGGERWAPSNKGVSAVFLPDPDPEFGQCVHKVTRDAADPDRLYLQNHWGSSAATTPGTTGRTSARACLRTSASPPQRIRTARTRSTSSRSTPTPTVSPPVTAAGCSVRVTPERPGSR